jgi:hypothetical protein
MNVVFCKRAVIGVKGGDALRSKHKIELLSNLRLEEA